MHMHQHTRAAHTRKSANMVSASMIAILPNVAQCLTAIPFKAMA